jgi:hypothetical protein
MSPHPATSPSLSDDDLVSSIYEFRQTAIFELNWLHIVAARTDFSAQTMASIIKALYDAAHSFALWCFAIKVASLPDRCRTDCVARMAKYTACRLSQARSAAQDEPGQRRKQGDSESQLSSVTWRFATTEMGAESSKMADCRN